METLTPQMILVMIMIGIAVFLFIVEWVRVDVVAILIMVALPLLHLVTPKEAFLGLGSNAVISIIAVIIIGAGLDKTGLINRLVSPILRIAGNSESRVIIAISVTVAGISSFMQNIGAAALFLPAIQRISKNMKIPLSQLLMPIGFSAILGGTVTLVGCSPLILLNDLLEPFGLKPFGLFDVTPIGLALVAGGIGCFIVLGRFILPKGIPHVLKVRVIADLADRVQAEMEREKISKTEARTLLLKDDEERRKWTQTLYGADPRDSSLYDLVVHIHKLTIADAVDIICDTVVREPFKTTKQAQQKIEDYAMASEMKAALSDSFDNIGVKSEYGNILVYAKGNDHHIQRIRKKAKEVANKMEGVNDLEVHATQKLPPKSV